MGPAATLHHPPRWRHLIGAVDRDVETSRGVRSAEVQHLEAEFEGLASRGGRGGHAAYFGASAPPVARAEAMDHSDRWVDEGCEVSSPLIALERAALIRSYAALLAAVHRP